MMGSWNQKKIEGSLEAILEGWKEEVLWESKTSAGEWTMKVEMKREEKMKSQGTSLMMTKTTMTMIATFDWVIK